MAKTIDSSYIFTPAERQGHSCVFAGPGAGKTHFLVNNIKQLVETDAAIVKSKRRKVLCITYTNAAADEIVRRLGGVAKRVVVSTIHAFVYEHIIKPFQLDLKRIMHEDFQIDVVGSGIISAQVEGFGILHGIEKDEVYHFIGAEIGNPGLPCDYGKKAMGSVEVDCTAFLDGGQKRLKNDSKVVPEHVRPIKKFIWNEARRLTHDEILYFGYRILEANPLACYSLRVKFPFVFVDEFQDTNPLQTHIIKLIGNANTHVCVVGDVAQSIYSFQGARPSDFLGFKIEGQECQQYQILNNRRSTGNIVNFCNFIRKSDLTVVQKDLCEERGPSIHFLLGNGPFVSNAIRETISGGGAVLTRAWAAAFNYIDGLDERQVKLLREIYNSYFPTTIQLRDEIAGKSSNVLWVKAFGFIFSLWHGYRIKSVNLIVSALESYVNVRREGLSVATLKDLVGVLDSIFADIDETSDRVAVSVIQTCVEQLKRASGASLAPLLSPWRAPEPMFDENESERRESAIEQLSWKSSYKLFNEVFSEKSHYMTVHQAKGLEWEKVFVGVEPSRMDRADLAFVYGESRIEGDDAQSEFVRLYYVACSRAKKELYIHIPAGKLTRAQIAFALDAYGSQTGQTIDYDFQGA